MEHLRYVVLSHSAMNPLLKVPHPHSLLYLQVLMKKRYKCLILIQYLWNKSEETPLNDIWCEWPGCHFDWMIYHTGNTNKGAPQCELSDVQLNCFCVWILFHKLSIGGTCPLNEISCEKIGYYWSWMSSYRCCKCNDAHLCALSRVQLRRISLCKTFHKLNTHKGVHLYELSYVQSIVLSGWNLSHNMNIYVGFPLNEFSCEFQGCLFDWMLYHIESKHRGVPLYELSGVHSYHFSLWKSYHKSSTYVGSRQKVFPYGM